MTNKINDFLCRLFKIIVSRRDDACDKVDLLSNIVKINTFTENIEKKICNSVCENIRAMSVFLYLQCTCDKEMHSPRNAH